MSAHSKHPGLVFVGKLLSVAPFPEFDLIMNAEQLQRNLRTTLPQGKLRITQPGYCPSISLYLYDPETLEGPRAHEVAQAVVAEPAYWSFCWASGQVLAQYLLDHPEWVRDKTVLDFGCGSGIVGIAAAKAGAGKVVACDIDAHALAATEANAQLNHVVVACLDDLSALNETVDLIVAADVLYDRDNLPLLSQFLQLAPQVLLADSRVKQLPTDALQRIVTHSARTWPNLNEFEEFNQVRIYASEPSTTTSERPTKRS